MNRRHVWVSGDADVDIYLEDESGNLSGGLLLEYCYLGNAAVQATMETQRRPVTGRENRKLTGHTFDDCQITCDFMLYKAALEIPPATIFKARQRLRVILKFIDPSYSHVDPFENDAFELHRALATVWSVSKPENGFVTSNATFLGESVLQTHPNS